MSTRACCGKSSTTGSVWCTRTLCNFREVFLTPVHLAIVMEYASGGDMFEYVIKHKLPHHGQGLLEDSARAFYQQLIIALEFCHELGIANRWASLSKDGAAYGMFQYLRWVLFGTSLSLHDCHGAVSSNATALFRALDRAENMATLIFSVCALSLSVLRSQGHQVGEYTARFGDPAAKREDLRFWIQQERICGLTPKDRQWNTGLYCTRGAHGRPV